jgi:exosortase
MSTGAESISAIWRRSRILHLAIVAWVAVLFSVACLPTLLGVAGSWFDPNADMGHGLAVPVTAGYMAWTKRERLSSLSVSTSTGGLFLAILGAIQFIVASAADWIFALRLSVLITFVGCLLCLFGRQVVKELAYPLLVLVLMIPPPTFLQTRVTLQLQLTASRLAEGWLDLLGYSVLRDGNVLRVVGERLAVAEACSGIRAMLSLFFFAVSYNFFFVRHSWVRSVLVLAVVPLAVISNAARIVATGIVAQHNRALAQGILHEVWGYLTIAIAGVLLVALHWLMVYFDHSRRQRLCPPSN